MSEIAFCNTKEGMHINAKQAGLKPWALGCSCYDCCKEFDKLIDDSLSDTQQENKMSVKELKLKTTNNELKIEAVLECFRASVTEDDVECVVYLDRSQAHLLMLYLQEHLK